jgi:hypothetical protein
VKGKALAYFSLIYPNFLEESDDVSRKISQDTQPVFQESKLALSLYKQETQMQNYRAGLTALISSYLLACHALCRHFTLLPNFSSACLSLLERDCVRPPSCSTDLLRSATILFD